ncbi:MAG: hypothetical protein IPO37_07155 [Saprospiraceae bacterium]|nr:hypothetical protein [Saprospiraceae bacterium]
MKKNYPNLDPQNAGHHEIMAKYFVDRIATLLRDLNNHIGTINDYKYIQQGIKDKSGKDLISAGDLSALKTLFINNIVSNPNTINCLWEINDLGNIYHFIICLFTR